MLTRKTCQKSKVPVWGRTKCKRKRYVELKQYFFRSEYVAPPQGKLVPPSEVGLFFTAQTGHLGLAPSPNVTSCPPPRFLCIHAIGEVGPSSPYHGLNMPSWPLEVDPWIRQAISAGANFRWWGGDHLPPPGFPGFWAPPLFLGIFHIPITIFEAQ